MSSTIVSNDTSFTNFIANTFKTGHFTHLPACGDIKEAFFISLFYEGEKAYFRNKHERASHNLGSDILGTLIRGTGDLLNFEGISPVNAFANFYHAFLRNQKNAMSYNNENNLVNIAHQGTLLFDITEEWAYGKFKMDVPAPKIEELPDVIIRRKTIKPK